MKPLARFLLAVAALLALMAVTLAVFGLPLRDSLELLAKGAGGDGVAWTRTAVRATPLLFCALGTILAWRAGMFNIGGEGQFIVGGISAATFARLAEGAPPMVLTVGMLACSIAGGGVYATFAGWLHVRRGVQVVISTILLNFVALQLLGWVVSGPLQQRTGGLPMSDRLPEAAMLWRLSRQSDLHGGVFLALFAAFGVALWLYGTRAGFRLRLVGEGPRVARAAGMDAGRIQVMAMAASGAFCGLAGGVEYSALAGQIGAGFSQQWGFLAIPVALVGALHPLGALVAAVGFGALFAGTENLARFTPEGGTLGYAIQGAAVLGFVAWQALRERRIRRTGVA
ncbi:MAG: ABC transporter permease [Fimbriimonadaceae bacterium]|nr:ABC transporter permease [Chthonomonadaceae bacterium]MCO5296849.1 ABC transporter permease [Fimbriimonadaceae bacterium]